MRTYPIRYNVEHGKFTREEIGEQGATDALIVHSILYPEDGSRSECIVSTDGNGNNLSDDELFKSWVMMAKSLIDSGLSPSKKAVCIEAFEKVQRAILAHRGGEIH